jgi:MFS transporter, DHA1 family, multidrug resistance protein
MKTGNGTGLRAPAFASLALAFASFGDAFLYPFLPLNYHLLGIPIAWVGILLSINRFVRIFSNTFMVYLFSKYGLRNVMIFAVLLAIISTAGYGIASAITSWIFFRICWGLAFSAMRIGTLGYAIQQQKQGIALGISKSLQEAGPALALFLFPVLLYYFHPEAFFLLLAAVSTPALYFAWKLPRQDDRTQPIETRWFVQWPSVLNSITLLSAILIDGMMVVVLGILFIRYQENISPITATALAAGYLGYRRICLVILSPAGGWIADKLGPDRVFKLSMVFVVAGLLVLVSGWIATGAVIVFTFYGVNATVTPGSVSKNHHHSLAAVAENATWRDIGAAIGTLIGGMLIASPYLTSILLVSIFGLAFLLLIHIGIPGRRVLKSSYLWK